MRSLLRSAWDEPRPAAAPPRVWRDWALLAVLGVLIPVEALLRPELPARIASTVLLLALLPTLLWRRTHPLAAVAVAFGTTALLPLVTGGAVAEGYTTAYLLLLPYALVRWGSGREITLGSAMVAGKILIWFLTGPAALGDALGGIAVMSTVTALGLAFRYRSRARQRELDGVRLRERERLARDLHDTVAHHVSAMAIRAQVGLATSDADPGAAAEALRLIEAEAARALAEMRAMVRVLRRGEPADVTPSPGIRDVTAFAGRGRGGPEVAVEITGDVTDVAPSVDAAVYRLAQESVTNARRHARHARRIEVRVDADADAVHLRVSDDGDGATGPRPSGYGIAGMVERAGLLGGTCAAGPGPGRGWTVTATLPRTGAA
ncbi:sensor histidine kinase [Couchioplanes azureus]|uniref:sensor histidine kinase n=1 Tax=Couchioplanes caeruleus TaxID=56438 RepID=UPI0016706C4D|nr:histidine kinase [Couchioplanes caeruleus]GGQ55810.1 two-component sensor histidine kinase [Couchioplanes caeruleus subsp. azureus]